MIILYKRNDETYLGFIYNGMYYAQLHNIFKPWYKVEIVTKPWSVLRVDGIKISI
jgi:hypothetical protein